MKLSNMTQKNVIVEGTEASLDHYYREEEVHLKII